MTGWHIKQGYSSNPTGIPWNAWARQMVEETIPAHLAEVKALCLAAGLTEDGDGEESLDTFLAHYVTRDDSTITLAPMIPEEATEEEIPHHPMWGWYDADGKGDRAQCLELESSGRVSLQIMQLASGGGASRDVKERVRAAVTAFVILESIKVGYTVNVAVY